MPTRGDDVAAGVERPAGAALGDELSSGLDPDPDDGDVAPDLCTVGQLHSLQRASVVLAEPGNDRAEAQSGAA